MCGEGGARVCVGYRGNDGYVHICLTTEGRHEMCFGLQMCDNEGDCLECYYYY